MEQIIVTNVDGSTVKLKSRERASSITKAEQSVAKLGEDTVNITVESAQKINFYLGAKITIYGRDYTLNIPAKERKLSENSFVYDLQFEGVQYDLLRCQYNVNVDTTGNIIQDLNGSSLTGDIKMFLDVLVFNANRIFPGKWSIGAYPANTETKTLTFGDTDTCLSVLQSLCSSDNYNTDFKIGIDVNGNRTINVGQDGSVFEHTFEYGKGKGVYELTRERVSQSNIVNRLFVYGGSKNIVTTKYRADKLCLPGKSKSQSYLEDAESIAKYGAWEGTQPFEDVFPHRTGVITALGDSVYKFVDTAMDFDLNEKETDGVTTKYLLAGQSAKVHINKGKLAGYEFEISKYDHSTKTFTIIKQTDENDYSFPSDTSSAFQFSVGDEYVLVDIYQPQTYIDAAELELQTKGASKLSIIAKPQIRYGLTIDKMFLYRYTAGNGSNIFWVGDYIKIKDTDLDVDKTISIIGFTRNLLDEYDYKLTISDLPVEVSIIVRTITDVSSINNVIKLNRLADPARARQNYKAAQEVLNMIFDEDGYFTDKIRPLSIETSMLSVGSTWQQFEITDNLFQPNYNGARNRIVYKGGTLSHLTVLDSSGSPRVWVLSDNDVTLASDAAYYIYAKCSKTSNTGLIIFDTSNILPDSDGSYYHFLLGVANSVDSLTSTRLLSLTYGGTTINGRFVKTGRIVSNDGITYFDLDTGEFSGKFTFQSGSSGYSNLTDKPDLSVYPLKTYVDALGSNLQSQIDGQIISWFNQVDPTTANAPASEWTTDVLKQQHANDTYTNLVTGGCWRWVYENSAWKWGVITDTATQAALAAAAKAQDTADGKRRAFISQPVPPYDLGDLWSQGTTGDLMKCNTARASGQAYAAGDWEKAAKYTDDTAVNNLQVGGRNLIKGTSKDNQQLNIANGYSYSFYLYPVTIASLGLKAGDWVTSTFKTGQISRNNNVSPSIEMDDGVTSQYFSGNHIGANSISSVICKIPEGITNIGAYIGLSNPFQSGDIVEVNSVKLEKGNKPTDWTPAPEDVQANIDEAKLTALVATARTEGLSGFDGGLGFSATMFFGLFNELQIGQETAGINGIKTDNNGVSLPAFWGGGTFSQAISLLANIVFNHNGDAKIGNLFIDNAGVLCIKDSNGVKRVIITRNNITTLAALAGEMQNSTVNNIANNCTEEGESCIELANQLVVSNNNSTVSISCDLETSINADIPDGSGGFSSVMLVLSNTATSENISIDSVAANYINKFVTKQITIDKELTLSAGTYKLKVIFNHHNISNCSFSSSISASTCVITFDSSTQRIEIGKNGIEIIGNGTNYSYFGIENGVFKVVEKTTGIYDRPGVLAAGTVSSAGVSSSKWGAKVGDSSKSSTGTYVIAHSIGHNAYTVQITPLNASRVGYISSKSTTSVTVILTNMSGTPTDAYFDYNIIGSN